MKEMLVFAGNANIRLFRNICQELPAVPGKSIVSRFPDGETKIEIGENVRGKDVFILQPLSPPVNDNLMELLLMVDALKRASARRVTAVIPYYGYARQDRKHKGRVPISARLVADLIETAGTDRVLTVDLHVPQIQGFFKIPVDHFPGHLAFENGFSENLENLVVVSPDAGSIQRAGPFANKLGVPLAIIDKRRITGVKVKVMIIIGDVRDKTVLLADDIVSTGGTMAENAEALIKEGAKSIIACATHGVFSPKAKDILDNSAIERIYVTDSVESIFPLSKKILYENSVAPFLAEGVRRINKNLSVGEIIEHT